MVKNKNDDDDEHYNIKEHYDENSFKPSDIQWWEYLLMGLALTLLFIGGLEFYYYLYPTDKTKTKVPDNTEIKPVTADLVLRGIDGVTPLKTGNHNMPNL